MKHEADMKRLPAVLMVLAGLGAFAACSSKNDGGAPPSLTEDSGASSGGDAGQTAASADAGEAGTQDAATPGPPAYVRIAQVSPDLPAIDVCIALHGTTDFQGPLVGQLAASLVAGASGDAGTEDASAPAPGLAYSQVSAYVPVNPGQYDVRLVAAGAMTCDVASTLAKTFADGDAGDAGVLADASTSGDASVVDAATGDVDGGSQTADASSPSDGGGDGSATGPGATDLPALAANAYATLLIGGDLTPAGSDPRLTFSVVTDDAVLAGGAVLLRAVNAVPSQPSLDFGLENAAAGDAGHPWLSVLTDVSFGAVSTKTGTNGGTVDANGYTPIVPLAAQGMSARVPGATTDLASASNVELDLGAIATVIAVGGKSGDTAHPPALLLCIDNLPVGGLLSDCSVAQ